MTEIKTNIEYCLTSRVKWTQRASDIACDHNKLTYCFIVMNQLFTGVVDTHVSSFECQYSVFFFISLLSIWRSTDISVKSNDFMYYSSWSPIREPSANIAPLVEIIAFLTLSPSLGKQKILKWEFAKGRWRFESKQLILAYLLSPVSMGKCKMQLQRAIYTPNKPLGKTRG